MGQALPLGFLFFCSVLLLYCSTATADGGSYFYSGYDEHVEVAKLNLKAATICDYGYSDDLNFLTCAPDEGRYPPSLDTAVPANPPDTVSRAGWCYVGYWGGYQTDSTDQLEISTFNVDCHINSDAGCPDSLGCSNLDISVQGLAYRMETKVVLTVEPRLTFPPFSNGCGNGGRRDGADSGKDGARHKPGGKKPHDLSSRPQVSKPAAAQILSGPYQGYDEYASLPTDVWILDPTVNDFTSAVYVYGGQASVFDRQAKRQVATGWMDFVQLYLNVPDDIPTNDGWRKIKSSEIPTGWLIIRDPYVYKFTFTKEAKHAPYAN